MFIIGHLGITVAIFALARKLPTFSGIPIDLRLVALGAMLPDLIDKPLGQVIFADTIGNGRMIAHSLLFCILLFIVGLYMYRERHYIGMLVISAATLLHLLEDRLWEIPQTLFWPLLGMEFYNSTPQIGFTEFFYNLLTISYTPAFNQGFVSEVIGLASLLGILMADRSRNLLK